MVGAGATYAVELGFAPASHAFPDPERAPVLRARPRAGTPYGDEAVEFHTCPATDMAQDESIRPDLFTFGFDQVDLAGHDAIQRACRDIRQDGHISDPAAAELREAITGAVLQSSSGRSLEVLYVADEGLIMRTGGPNRLSVVGPRSKGMNGHGPAMAVHGDQDVYGTPLVQLMEGRAPSLFRHDSPDGHNHGASLMLVNLWIPIQQITQPLVLGDGRSVDRPRHQLRFGLATETFLDRDADQAVNDIWNFLHHPGQQWYFRSDMDHRSAYVFNTLSTPHTSTVLPGEEVAERLYVALAAAEAATERGDVAAFRLALADVGDVEVPDRAPPALRRAIADMVDLLQEATADPASLCEAQTGWSSSSRTARRRVVRMSLELRLVVSVDT